MIQQAEGLKHDPRLMLIDDADRPAKWYFALKANLLEARRSGAPIVHPMTGRRRFAGAVRLDHNQIRSGEQCWENPARL